MNDLSEPASKSFVDAASAVYNRALTVPSVRAFIAEAEDEFGVRTPLASIYTLDTIVKRADGDHVIAWVIASILHSVHAGHLGLSDFGVRALTGKGSGGKGHIDVYNFHFKFLRFLAMPSWTSTPSAPRQRSPCGA